MESRLIGKEARITNRDSIWFDAWGIIQHFDGERYHIAIWGGNECMVFDRDEFRVRRG